MADTVYVQWCPTRGSWEKSELISREISRTSVATDDQSDLEFDYYRKHWRCTACEVEFTTFRSVRHEGRDAWRINSELSRMQSESADPEGHSGWMIPMAERSAEPELSLVTKIADIDRPAALGWKVKFA